MQANATEMNNIDVKALLNEEGISIGQIARAANVTRSTASRVINGLSRSRRIASIVADYLGQPANTLWPGKYPENGYRRNRVTSLAKLQEIARNYPRAA